MAQRQTPLPRAEGAPVAASAVPGLSRIVRRVVAWYVVLGSGWIVASDLAIAAVSDTDVVADVSKGLVFVGGSGAVLWFVLRGVTVGFDRRFTDTVTAQRDLYQAVLRTSSDIVAIVDREGRFRYVNDAVQEILGWTPEEMVGEPAQTFVHPSDRAAATAFRENALLAVTGIRSRRTFLLLGRDGSYRSMELTGAPIEIDDGWALVLNGRDVTERARSEQQLRAALAEDATGLPNLRMFVTEMERLAEVGPSGLTVTVVLLDVDRFSDVNALHGRPGGDAVLRELARRAEAALPEAIGLWRHGADEILAVILDDTVAPVSGSGGLDPDALVERIQREASAPLALDETDGRVSVSVSVGIAQVVMDRRDHQETPSTVLLRAAEAALADAKRHPDRRALRVLDRSGSAIADRARFVAELHDAVEDAELAVHYQPKIRLSDLTVIGAEALVRWPHPERGLLAPSAFLPAVEQANLSGSLTKLVLRDALRRLVEWRGRPDVGEGFRVSVNISLDDLRRRRFVGEVFDALERAGAAPEGLVLELTEQAMLADSIGARDVVDELRHNGIGIAIDDFGTGYSTLEHIRVFEVDELKLDKGFVQRIGTSPVDEAIVDSVLAIAKRLGLVVTAEGIEEPGALAYLRERDCDWGQGYLFGRPVPAEQLVLGPLQLPRPDAAQ